MVMDEASVTFVAHSNPVDVYGITSECYQCDPQPIVKLSSHQNYSKLLDTRWPYKLLFEIKHGADVNEQRFEKLFLEHGEYRIDIQSNITSKIVGCSILKDPPNAFLPFIIFISVLAGLAILWPTVKYCKRMYKRHKGEDNNYFVEMDEWDSKVDSLSNRNSVVSMNNNDDSKQKPKVKTKRLRSLDTFRGIAIVVMIFVNYSGGHYYFIDHAVWNGLTVADLVFPWFIFIMGTSMNLSYKSVIKRQVKLTTALWQITIRSFKLFVIGLVLNFGQNLATWRVPGVLQRFGICYFFVGSLNLLTTPSEAKLNNWKFLPRYLSIFRDILPYWFQWLVILSVVAAHTAITFLLEVPGCPKGYLGPGGLAEHGAYYNCTGGAAGYIDRYFLGDSHIYGNPTFKQIYQSGSVKMQHFDPEGVLGCLPSIVLTFLGLQAGRTLFSYEPHSSRIKRWIAWTLITGAIGIGLTLGTKDDGIIPINKNLWSLSFVLVTASTSYLLFIICYVLCDVRHWWNGSPFFFCGMNAVFLYVGHMCVPFRVFWHENPQSHLSYLVVATFNAFVWVTWAFVLYKKKLFFTV